MLEKTSKSKAAPVKENAKNLSVTKKLELAKKYKLGKVEMLEMLTNIYTSRKIDDAEISMKKQSKAFFQISSAGHEGILTAAARVLKPTHDWFLGYYRDV
jgi:2-oxoisovalerate dehydrogenase E1 component